MKYRIGLDLGTNSIGWAVIELDNNHKPLAVIDGNSRIFSDSRDPKSKTSLAVTRREARGARRNRDRFLQRQKKLMNLLIDYGLMPSEKEKQKELEKNDPYYLRYKGLDNALEPYELGRVLFALNQRRGFKSNRKEGKKEGNSDYIKTIKEFEESLKESGWRTLGEYYWKEKKSPIKGDIERVYSVRYRASENDPYPTRIMYQDEFKVIQTSQKNYHNLTDQQWNQLFDAIFIQRPLKPVERGNCQLYFNKSDLKPKEKKRAYKALPSAEKCRVWQDIHNLRIITDKFERIPLTMEQKNLIYKTMSSQNSVDFNKIKKLLNKPECRLNFETQNKKKIPGMKTNAMLQKSKFFGSQWTNFDDQKKDDIVTVLLEEEDPENIKNKALSEWNVTEEQAKAISEIEIKKFESGTSRFCETALRDLVILMEKGTDFYDAQSELDSNFLIKNNPKLDYYGKVIPEVITNSGIYRSNEDEKKSGIIGNPTVHVGLNQLRAVVNAIIDRYGKPTEINLELARDLKMTQEQNKVYQRKQKENEDKNNDIKEKLEELESTYGQIITNNYDNRLKYKLWEELGEPKLCVYTGKPISFSILYTEEIEIEHIIPLSVSQDDSPANKTLCFSTANREKKEKTPFEAFHNHPNYDYEQIILRAYKLPTNKQWRFHENALERFNDKNEFLQRQLHDTQYLSKVSRQYLATLFNEDKYVRVLPGKLTAKLRHDWGINKDRNNHRHHFIDAVIVGLTDTSVIQSANIKSKFNALDSITYPCPIEKDTFIRQVSEISNNLIVSHRYRHHDNAELHDQTNYGLVSNKEKEDFGYNLVCRKSVDNLNKAKDIELIRNPSIREELSILVKDVTEKQIPEIIKTYFMQKNIKYIRLYKKDNSAVAIKHNQHTKWVIPGDTHHVKLWECPDEEIKGVGVSFFELNKPNYKTTSFRPKDNVGREISTAKYITKIHKGDLFECDYQGARVVGKIISLKPSSNSIKFIFHYESSKDAFQKNIQFSNWKKQNCKKLHLDVLGQKK